MTRLTYAFAALLFWVVPALAQEPIDRGTWLVGGSARFVGLHDRANDQDEFGFELAPSGGVFILRGLALTSELRFGWATRERRGRVLTYGVGPGLSYYFTGKRSRLYPYVSLRSLWVRAEFEPSDDAPFLEPSDDTDWVWTVAGGAAVFLARNAAVTGELFYSRARFTLDGAQRNENSSVQYGLQFGIRVFLY